MAAGTADRDALAELLHDNDVGPAHLCRACVATADRLIAAGVTGPNHDCFWGTRPERNDTEVTLDISDEDWEAWAASMEDFS